FFPNPFHSTANLSFQLMQAERVRVLLYDPLGRKVRTLLEETLPPGEFERAIDLKGFPGGLYYLHLQTDSTEQVIRVLHLY
ncbi:MAG: T9SS type A sorting domain-containing protein, partial [Saprospiraceae bacterium]|nr:T9SS type A sorting domain-containing protein [Saprospiraceae bacterium]